MPEQGPRPLVGDQGGGGALLTPIRRLTLAGVGLIIGGMLIAVGSRMTWATVTPRSTPVSLPGFPRLSLRGGDVAASGANLDVGYLSGLGLMIALVALGWLTAGPRTRVWLSLLALVAAVGAGIITFQVRSEVSERAVAFVRTEVGDPNLEIRRVATGPGIGVTAAGAAVSILSAIAGGIAGRRVPRMRMPDSPGGEPPA